MSELKRLLKRDWWYFLGVALLFIVGIFVGEHLQKISPFLTKLIQEQGISKFYQMAESLKDQPAVAWIVTIWLNNIIVCLTTLLLGLLFPIFPPFMVIFNGLVVGLFQKIMQHQTGLSLSTYYISLLPHGVFELTALFITAGLAIRFGLIPYRLIWHYAKSGEHKPFFKEFMKEGRYYGLLILCLLTIAAVFEVTVSPLLMHQ